MVVVVGMMSAVVVGPGVAVVIMVVTSRRVGVDADVVVLGAEVAVE
jgi:hypothetical protein